MKKIMFNDRYGLTAAVLNGRKTMTRRIIPEKEAKRLDSFYGGDDWYYAVGTCIDESSRFDIGEVLAVAQPYKDIVDNKFFVNQCLANGEAPSSKKYDAGWGNKMFVGSYYMPHRVRITNIKVERLQDISEEDCLKEGIQEYFPYIDRNPDDKVRTFQYFKEGKIRHRISPASKCFAHLIDDVSGKGTWDSNPWVFVYEFELVK